MSGQISSYVSNLTTDQIAAFRASHKVTAKAEVYFQGQYVTDVPIVTGQITVDRTADNCRSGGLTVGDPSFAPTFVNSPLAPYGCELKIYSGLVYDSGAATTWIPLGIFTLDDVECEDSTGDLPELTFYDRSKVLQRANFRGPISRGGYDVRTLLGHMIQDVMPYAAVYIDSSLTATPKVPGGTIFSGDDGGRWTAIQQLCSWLGGEGRFGYDGNFYVVPVPTLIGVSSPSAVWTFDAGDGGVLVQAKRGISRAGCYNFVTCTGNSSGGNGPVPFGTAHDSDPRSPTYWSGDVYPTLSAFGSNVLNVSNDQLTTNAECAAYAQQTLNNVLGLARSLNFTAVPAPFLDAGDIVKVVYKDGLYEYHLLDSFSVPLGSDGQFTGTTRTQTYQYSGGT